MDVGYGDQANGVGFERSRELGELPRDITCNPDADENANRWGIRRRSAGRKPRCDVIAFPPCHVTTFQLRPNPLD
jgi:hypothetical protein